MRTNFDLLKRKLLEKVSKQVEQRPMEEKIATKAEQNIKSDREVDTVSTKNLNEDYVILL